MKDTLEDINAYLEGSGFKCYEQDENYKDYLLICREYGSNIEYPFILERDEYSDGYSHFKSENGHITKTVPGLWYVMLSEEKEGMYLYKGFKSYKIALQEALHKCMREAMDLADVSRKTWNMLSVKQ